MINVSSVAALYGTSEVMQALLEFVHGDVLDFGAGVGKQKSLLLTRADSYTALDIAPHPSIDIVGDVLSAPLPDASYDTIVSNQVMEHVREPWTMVTEIARILRPGGTCILTAPFLVPYHAHPNDFFRFTEEGIRSLCERAGLTVTLCTKYGGFWATIGETMKMRFFSPYQQHSRIRKHIGRLAEKLCRFLNQWSTPKINYANVVCVARKE